MIVMETSMLISRVSKENVCPTRLIFLFFLFTCLNIHLTNEMTSQKKNREKKNELHLYEMTYETCSQSLDIRIFKTSLFFSLSRFALFA